MPELIDEQRLIDARSLMRIIMNHEISMSVCLTQDEQCGMARMRKMVIEDIHSSPTIEAEPVKHGRWIDKGGCAVCTECGGKSGTQYDGVEPIPRMTQFCPNCGANMKEDFRECQI